MAPLDPQCPILPHSNKAPCFGCCRLPLRRKRTSTHLDLVLNPPSNPKDVGWLVLAEPIRPFVRVHTWKAGSCQPRSGNPATIKMCVAALSMAAELLCMPRIMAHPPIDHGNGGGGGSALAPGVDLAAGVASILTQIAVGAEGHTSIASHYNAAETPRRWRTTATRASSSTSR